MDPDAVGRAAPGLIERPYDEASADTVDGELGDVTVRCIGFEALLRNERATGRTKDLADAEALKQSRRHRRG